jgi:hypothetical protein
VLDLIGGNDPVDDEIGVLGDPHGAESINDRFQSVYSVLCTEYLLEMLELDPGSPKLKEMD